MEAVYDNICSYALYIHVYLEKSNYWLIPFTGIGISGNSMYCHSLMSRNLNSYTCVSCILGRHPRGFPAHQPELDSPYLKAINNSWQTTNNAAYIDPKLQRNPALLLSEDPELNRCQEKPWFSSVKCLLAAFVFVHISTSATSLISFKISVWIFLTVLGFGFMNFKPIDSEYAAN